jgi:hypothetical protein
MKSVLLSVLLTSSTLMMLPDSAFAQDCPSLTTSEIIVNDPNDDIRLRTDPATDGQNIPNTNRGRAVINNGEKLLIDQDKDPKNSYGVCFYPVKINQTNNPSNTNSNVINYEPYWISQKGIKDYQKFVDTPEVNDTQNPESNPPEKIDNNIDNSNSPGWSLPSWLPGMSNLIFNLLTLILLGFILKKITDISSISSTLDKKIIKLFQEQNLKFSKESQDTQRLVGRNKEHIKELEKSFNTQNKSLHSLVNYISNGSLAFSISELLNQQINPGRAVSGVMSESQQSEQHQADSIPVSDEDNIQDAQQNSGHDHDPFYSDVISRFNTGSIHWFSDLIQQQDFLRVQITRDSVLGQMDMGGKVTQLEFNEQGTLLIYQADDKTWVIPDQTQSKWKRYVPDSLFNGNEQTLLRPAKVEPIGNNLWQLVEKGEFK